MTVTSVGNVTSGCRAWEWRARGDSQHACSSELLTRRVTFFRSSQRFTPTPCVPVCVSCLADPRRESNGIYLRNTAAVEAGSCAPGSLDTVVEHQHSDEVSDAADEEPTAASAPDSAPAGGDTDDLMTIDFAHVSASTVVHNVVAASDTEPGPLPAETDFLSSDVDDGDVDNATASPSSCSPMADTCNAEHVTSKTGVTGLTAEVTHGPVTDEEYTLAPIPIGEVSYEPDATPIEVVVIPNDADTPVESHVTRTFITAAPPRPQAQSAPAPRHGAVTRGAAVTCPKSPYLRVLKRVRSKVRVSSTTATLNQVRQEMVAMHKQKLAHQRQYERMHSGAAPVAVPPRSVKELTVVRGGCTLVVHVPVGRPHQRACVWVEPCDIRMRVWMSVWGNKL